MKKQVVHIHGGETFDTYELYIENLKKSTFDPTKDARKSWKNLLEETLGNNYEILMPRMPNKQNAKFLEWKIWFEKVIPFIKEEVIFIGASLGGIFLAKYLSENKFPKTILATFLIGAPFDEEGTKHSPADFVLPKNLNEFQNQGGSIYLYHSKDDPIVPFSNLAKYQEMLPKAHTMIFKDRGHFNNEKFPEIIEAIKHIS